VRRSNWLTIVHLVADHKKERDECDMKKSAKGAGLSSVFITTLTYLPTQRAFLGKSSPVSSACIIESRGLLGEGEDAPIRASTTSRAMSWHATVQSIVAKYVGTWSDGHHYMTAWTTWQS
jgi:hypothetical protein